MTHAFKKEPGKDLECQWTEVDHPPADPGNAKTLKYFDAADDEGKNT